MTEFLRLLFCQLFAAGGGWFAANNITTDTTASILIGLGMMGIGVIGSYVAKTWKMDLFTGNEQFHRVLIGAVVSQGITALSTYLAVDANNPQVLLVALANVVGSKLGVHQKLAAIGARGAVRLLIFVPCSWFLVSCANNPNAKQELMTFGKRLALTAGEAAVVIARFELATKTQAWLDAKTKGDPVKTALAAAAMQGAQQTLNAAEKALQKQRAKLDAKQPRDVQPGGQTSASAEVGVPACLFYPATPKTETVQLAAALEGQKTTAQLYPTGQCNSGATQSRPLPARAVKVMASAAHTETSREGRLSEGHVTIPHYGTRVAAQLAAR